MNGEVTDWPADGLLIVTPVPLLFETAADVLPLVTVMATFAMQDAPEPPHDLTCKVCAPAEAVTEAATEVAFTIAVLVLLSSE